MSSGDDAKANDQDLLFKVSTKANGKWQLTTQTQRHRVGTEGPINNRRPPLLTRWVSNSIESCDHRRMTNSKANLSLQTPPVANPLRNISISGKDTNSRQVGIFLISSSIIFFTFTIYSTIISKLLPEPQNLILKYIRQDYYYCLLVPLSIIVTIYFIASNWLGMKFFKHN
jgi:hypothetical protein